MIHETAHLLELQEAAHQIYSAWLEAPGIADSCQPGQFVNILPSAEWDRMMRRPMSLAGVSGNAVRIIFKVVGPGTLQMSRWQTGEAVDLLGPLGNFWSGYREHAPVLVGGGVGLAPILYLHEYLTAEKIRHDLILGARSGNEHFLQHDPDNHIFLATDDGSLGIHGNVIDVLTRCVISENQHSDCKIFGCGPPAMNQALRHYSISTQTKCDLALEQIMACGFGNCQGCVIEKKGPNSDQGSYRQKFALVCKDGPIFNAQELA